MKQQKATSWTTRSSTATNSRTGHAPTITATPQPARMIRVLLVDDHPVVRKGVRACLAQAPDIEIIGEAQDGEEALRMTQELAPDVLLMDIGMPRINGLAVTERLREQKSGVRVLILSSYTTTEYVLRIIRSGATGYVLKAAAAEEMIRGVRTVYTGQVFFSNQVAHLALNQFVRRSQEGVEVADLSEREREIVTHIAEGLSNKEIACKLNIGTRTVETHRERLMRKLNIRSIAGLTRFAILNGYIPFPNLAAAVAA